MNYRLFGNTGLRVSELGCLCSHMGGTAGRRDDREVRATLAAALSNGVNFFDAGDIYGRSSAEELLGKALKGRRNSVVLAARSPLRQDITPTYLRFAIEEGLRRLRTDRLDLFQLHDPPLAPAETGGLLEVLASLKREGKVRHYGVSCRTARDAGYWLQHPGIASLQIRLNLATFQEVRAILHRAARRGIAVIARQPFAAGHSERLDVHCFLAREGRTLAQAALQFALQFPEVSVANAGMYTREHLRESLQALQPPPVHEETLEQMDHAAGAFVN